MNWQKSLKGKIKFNEPLKIHTTLRIGGGAKFFIEPRDTEDLKFLLKELKRDNISPLVIGAGSNILANDKGLDCAVLRLNSPNFKKIALQGNRLETGAGITLNKLVDFAQRNGLGGVEFLAGIPGTLGGALIMNAGAWGKNIARLVESVRVISYNNKIKVLKQKDIGFGYRSSGLSKYIILSASLRLAKKKKSAIKERIKGYLRQRMMQQDFSRPSAGCVFKNPKGNAAGRLIDLCGLKGRRIGGACISTKHANFILNQKNAQASDVLKLMQLIRKEVSNKFSINLEPELKIWQ